MYIYIYVYVYIYTYIYVYIYIYVYAYKHFRSHFGSSETSFEGVQPFSRLRPWLPTQARRLVSLQAGFSLVRATLRRA